MGHMTSHSKWLVTCLWDFDLYLVLYQATVSYHQSDWNQTWCVPWGMGLDPVCNALSLLFVVGHLDHVSSVTQHTTCHISFNSALNHIFLFVIYSNILVYKHSPLDISARADISQIWLILRSCFFSTISHEDMTSFVFFYHLTTHSTHEPKASNL